MAYVLQHQATLVNESTAELVMQLIEGSVPCADGTNEVVDPHTVNVMFECGPCAGEKKVFWSCTDRLRFPATQGRPSLVANTSALRRLVLDFHIWAETPPSIQVQVMNWLLKLCHHPTPLQVDVSQTQIVSTQDEHGFWNATRLRKCGAATELLHILSTWMPHFQEHPAPLLPMTRLLKTLILETQGVRLSELISFSSFLAVGLRCHDSSDQRSVTAVSPLCPDCIGLQIGCVWFFTCGLNNSTGHGESRV